MNNRLTRILLASCLLGFTAPVLAQSKHCPPAQADAAEAIVDHLDSWQAVSRAFKAFRTCDDGSIAEGFSAGIVRLLATQWQTLPALAGLIARDPALKTFVLRHIDTTVNAAHLERVRQYAGASCPANAALLCRQIKHAATRTLKKMDAASQ